MRRSACFLIVVRFSEKEKFFLRFQPVDVQVSGENKLWKKQRLS